MKLYVHLSIRLRNVALNSAHVTLRFTEQKYIRRCGTIYMYTRARARACKAKQIMVPNSDRSNLSWNHSKIYLQQLQIP